MWRGVAMAAVPIAIMVMTAGCGKRDRLYEATPVLESPAPSPSSTASIQVEKHAAVAPRGMVRHDEMHEAELARRILELAATSVTFTDDDAETVEFELTENERLLSAELIQ